MKAGQGHLWRRCAASAAAGATACGAARAELVLATAAFTALGVGVLLLVNASLRPELPLRAAAPAGSEATVPEGQVEPLRQELRAAFSAALPTAEAPTEELDPTLGAPSPGSFDLLGADATSLEQQLLSVGLGEGRHEEKLRLLRELARSARTDKLEWLAFAARHLPEMPTAKGEALGAVALGLIADLSVGDDAARATLDALAFETKELHVVLRRRAAALAAERCPAHESDRVRRRLLAEEEPSVVAATLDALDARAEEPGVREWLGDFAGWRRPVAGEP